MPYISLPNRFSAFRRIIWIIELVGVLIVFGSLYLVHGGLKPNVQPPPPSAPYLGTDKAPPGLPAPSPLFVEDDSAADQAPAYTGPFPPEPLDADKTAAEAAQMLTNSKPNINAASSGGSASPENIGLLVCSPVPTINSSPDIRNFAVGCSDWLQLIAAGQPELGRTALLECGDG